MLAFRDVGQAAYESLQISGVGKDGMANSVDPLHHSVRQKDTELLFVIGFFHDCAVGDALPLRAILRRAASEIFSPSGCSLDRTQAVNAVPLLGKVHYLP